MGTPNDFFNLELSIPGYREQTMIAEVISNVHSDILYQRDYLGALAEQKKGLMQVLLTGKKRLNYDLYD